MSILLDYGDRLRAKDFLVRQVSLDVARVLVQEHHYARGGSNTAVATHGLFRTDDPETVLGVAWWLPPTKVAAQSVWENWRAVLALSRLVVLPGVPKNAAGFLIMRSVRLLRETDPRWECLLTYADEWQRHEGTIYRATNWQYVGRTKEYPVWVDEHGRAVSKKRGPKTFSRAEMNSMYTYMGSFAKHKYRMPLEPVEVRRAA